MARTNIAVIEETKAKIGDLKKFYQKETGLPKLSQESALKLAIDELHEIKSKQHQEIPQ